MTQKVIKWTKEGYSGGYSDYSCGGLLYFNVFFWFQFYCFADSVVLFTSSEKSLHLSHRLLAGYLHCEVRLMHCKVLLYCIWKDFEDIIMLWGYSDSLVFLLIHSLSTRAEPA